MSAPNEKKYLTASIIFHGLIVAVLVLGLDTIKPLNVFENTNKNDVISAVILGDTAKSKIVPVKIAAAPKPEPIKEVVKAEPKPEPVPVPQPNKPVVAKKEEVKKEAIALKVQPKKPKLEFKPNDLLADIKKQTQKQKKINQKQLQAQFAKTLRQQAEKTMRQNLLDENIKLSSTQSRQAQGIVNKYQALLTQAISEHWVFPPQTNKKLSCVLLIRTAPGGTVLDVKITKSSGDTALDNSARAAVMKSSPLPVPTDPAVFESFRQFALTMKPENVIS